MGETFSKMTTILKIINCKIGMRNIGNSSKTTKYLCAFSRKEFSIQPNRLQVSKVPLNIKSDDVTSATSRSQRLRSELVI